MTYTNAKKLVNDATVVIKKTKATVTVADIDLQDKDCFVLCDDGNVYHHRDLA